MRPVLTGLLIALALTLLAAPALAQHANPRVTYQGFMTDNVNNPLTATAVPIEIRLWADQTLTTLLFRESHSIDVTNGRFSLEIGAGTQPGGTPTPAHTSLDQVPFGSPVFFTMVINTEETNPIEFNFTPFAFFSLDSERVGGQLLSDLDARYITTLGGQTVGGAFTVDGTLTVASGVLTVPASGNVVVTPSGGIVDLQGDTSVTGLLTVTGNTSLTGLLDVTGDATITGSLTVTDGVNAILTASRTGSTTTVQALDNAGLPFLTATNDGANSSLSLNDGATNVLTADATGLNLASGGLSIGGTSTIGANRSGAFTGLSLGLRNLVGPTTYALAADDHVLVGDVQTSDVEIDLPDLVAGDDGRLLRIVRVDPTGSSIARVIIRPDASDTIGGNFTLASPLIIDGTSFAQAILLVGDFANADWRILDTGGGTGGAISASSATINPGPLVVDDGATQTTVTGGTINTVDVVASNSITGGTISGTTITGTSFTDGTATLTGGDLTGANSVTANDGTFTNLNSGNVNLTGGTLDAVTITNSTISGNGAGLTDLDATAITTGTLDDARLSANVFFVDGSRAMAAALDLNGNDLNNGGTLNATTVAATNVNTGNATITGGTLDSVGITNSTFSGTVTITGGTLDSVSLTNSTFSGTVTITSGMLDGVAITNSTIDSTPIGATTPDAGTFTNATVTSLTDGAATLTGGNLTGLNTLDTDAGRIGGLTVGYTRVTGPTTHTVLSDEHTICAIVQPAGGVTVTLPTAVDGRVLRIIRVDPTSSGQLVQIDAQPGETINGQPSLTISDASLFQTVTITADTFGTPDWKVTDLPAIVDLDLAGNLTVQGTGTFEGLLTANNGATINNAPLTANAGASVTGGLNTDNATVSGLLTAASVDVDGGTIDGTTIGGATPAAGTFTTLDATTTTTTNLITSNATITGGTLDSVAITASSFDGTVNVTGGTLDSVAITNSTFGGTVAITGGAIDGTTIGGTTAAAGTFTSVAANMIALGDPTAPTAGTVMLHDNDGLTLFTGAVQTVGSLTGNRTYTLPDVSGEVTVQGNAFNGPDQLVQLDPGGALPALDGNALTNLNSGALVGPLPALDGSALVNLDASNIALGTLADARLSTNVFFVDGSRTMSGNLDMDSNDITNVTTITADTVNALTLTGDGSGITNLDAAQVTTGTLDDNRLSPNVFLADGSVAMTGNFNGGGNDISNVNALSATTLAGNGAAITDLDASNINAGTLGDAFLSTNVFFVDGSRAMTGNLDADSNDVNNVNALNATTLNGGTLDVGSGNATVDGNGNLAIAGFTAGFRTVSSGPVAITPEDHTVDVSAGPGVVQVNLEDLGTVTAGRLITVIRSGAGDVQINANGAQTIDGNPSVTIDNASVQQAIVLVAASATEWKSVGASNATFPTVLTLDTINGNPNLTINAGTIDLNGNTDVTGTLSSSSTLTVSSGGANITGTTTINGDTTVTGNVLPGVATNNLGAGATRWNTVFATSLDANAATLGTASIGTTLSVGTTTTTGDLSVTNQVLSNLIPFPGRNLGSAGNRWASLFATTVDAANATVSGTVAANDVRLAATGGLDSVLLNGAGTPFIYSGTATLAAGMITIALPGVTSGSIVTATHRSSMTGDAAGLLTATAGAGSITITSSFPGDINDINYIVIVNP